MIYLSIWKGPSYIKMHVLELIFEGSKWLRVSPTCSKVNPSVSTCNRIEYVYENSVIITYLDYAYSPECQNEKLWYAL